MSHKTNSSLKLNLKNTVLISLFTAVIAVCAFITVPSSVPFTLQSLGIFFALTLLGGKHGTLSVIIYIFLGIIGLPVFSGFSGGLGHLSGPTGGYIIGFILTSLFYWLVTHFFGEKTFVKAISLSGGTIICYLFGSLWYCTFYLKDLTPTGFAASVGVCVLPFIIPDALKLAAALLIERRLQKFIK